VQKGLQMLDAPDVVDHDEAALPIELLRYLDHRFVLTLEPGPLAGQRGINAFELDDDLRLLAERHPEDTAVEGGEDVGVMTDAKSERCLSESSRSMEDDGLAAGILVIRIQNRIDDAMKECRSIDEVRRQIGGHVRRPCRLTWILENRDEPLPVAVEVIGLNLLHPDRQMAAELLELLLRRRGLERRFDGDDAPALLARVSPFLFHPEGTHCRGCHDQHEIVGRLDARLDLILEVARGHADPVLPWSDIGLFAEAAHQFRRVALVDARVRDEDGSLASHLRLRKNGFVIVTQTERGAQLRPSCRRSGGPSRVAVAQSDPAGAQPDQSTRFRSSTGR